MKTLKYSISFLIIVLFTVCSLNIIKDNGGASETVNASVIIQDTIIEIQTTAEKDLEMEVCIINDSYSPLDSIDIYNSSIISNSDPQKNSNAPGIYNIFLFNKDSLLSCPFFKIQLPNNEKDTLTDTFSISGSINGSVIISDTMSEQQQVPVLVYLKGTPFLKQLINNYTYSFEHIPRGNYTIVAEVVDVANSQDASEKGDMTDSTFHGMKSAVNDWSKQVSEEISLESGGSINGLNLRLSD